MQERGDFADVNGGHGVNFLLVPQKKRKRKTKSVKKLRSLSLFRRRRHPRPPTPRGRTRENRRGLPARPLATCHLRPSLIWQVALPRYANAERGDGQVSVPLTHSEVIRVRDALSLNPVNKEASTSTGSVGVLLAIKCARELTSLPTKRSTEPESPAPSGL